jgi:tRNA dimethylallyltransferase
LERDPLLVVILGPTGSGKTALSLELAEHVNGEIVNCDSVAMYREFYIGTAKPSREEQDRVRHHLLDVIDPTGYTTAGEYSRQARAVIREISKRGALPIAVGGTGLYLRALIDGLFRGPLRSESLRKKLRMRAEEKGPEHLHGILQRLDKAAAVRIHANDIPKVIRAIEVCLATRQPMSNQWEQGRDALKGFRVLRIALDPDRQQLYDRINQRVQHMFAQGLIEETQNLLQKYGESARPLSSIGYKQVVELIAGKLTREEAVRSVQQAHRNYAKRQITWFRREPDVKWIVGFGDERSVIEQSISSIRETR